MKLIKNYAYFELHGKEINRQYNNYFFPRKPLIPCSHPGREDDSSRSAALLALPYLIQPRC